MQKAIQALKNPKFQRRARAVLTNSINNLLLMALGPLVSFLVIRLASVDLWGEFVNVLLIVQLGMHFVSWGNKEYLLRAFSLNPAQLPRNWQVSLFSRSILFAGFCLVMSLLFPARQIPAIVVWGLGLGLAQSHEVLILYRKDFIFAALVEAGLLAGLVTPIIWLAEALTLDHLLGLFAVTTLIKGLIFLLRFRQYTLTKTEAKDTRRGRFELRYFALAFPFFLLGFSGMLHSRIDLYAVNFFLPKTEVGQYQVFSNFLIYVQSISAFILMPFVKNIYRLGYKAIFKISIRLFTLGGMILPPSLVAIHLVLTYLYQIRLPVTFLIVGGISILPIYFFLPIIYAMYKGGLQTTVLKINLAGILVSLLLNIILLPRLGMIGAVITTALMKWMILVIYLIQGRTAVKDKYALTVSKLPSES